MYFDHVTKIIFYETVDVHKLHYILCNKDQYADHITDKDDIDIVFNSLSKYLGLVNAGRVKIQYMKQLLVLLSNIIFFHLL